MMIATWLTRTRYKSIFSNLLSTRMNICTSGNELHLMHFQYSFFSALISFNIKSTARDQNNQNICEQTNEYEWRKQTLQIKFFFDLSPSPLPTAHRHRSSSSFLCSYWWSGLVWSGLVWPSDYKNKHHFQNNKNETRRITNKLNKWMNKLDYKYMYKKKILICI